MSDAQECSLIGFADRRYRMLAAIVTRTYCVSNQSKALPDIVINTPMLGLRIRAMPR